MADKYCRKCGGKIREGGRFCPKCGTQVALDMEDENVDMLYNIQHVNTTATPNGSFWKHGVWKAAWVLFLLLPYLYAVDVIDLGNIMSGNILSFNSVRITTGKGDGEYCNRLVDNAKNLEELHDAVETIRKYMDAYNKAIYKGKISHSQYEDFIMTCPGDKRIDDVSAYIVEFGHSVNEQ